MAVVSGPVSAVDAPAIVAADPGAVTAPAFERFESREADVGGVAVRRALPKRRRRTIGAWCFVDHFGPAAMRDRSAMQVGPHPHIGLHTVTWLVGGEALHTDSLGSEQVVRPGQLNLMTAGRGVAHAEEAPTGRPGSLHGAQLWVAQPDGTRHGGPAFEHHAELPVAGFGTLAATVLVGALGDDASPARADTPLLGCAVVAPRQGGSGTVPLDPAFEHGVVVLDGALVVDGERVRPGELAYLGAGRHELPVAADGPAHALLLGGVPFGETPLMWWNFVARTREEIEEAWADWQGAPSDRFGPVRSGLERIAAPRPTWLR